MTTAAAIERSRHGELPERTYRMLLEKIIRGRLSPGERLTEASIALEFGVSRTPVREALARLTHERFVVPVTAGRRSELAVAPLDASSVGELWAIIGALEAQAVRNVAQLDAAERKRIVDTLNALNQDLRRAGQERPRDPDRLFEAQTRFHDGFVCIGAGPYVMTLHDTVRPHVQRYEWAYGTRHEARINESADEHSEIIAAIGRGNADAAAAAVESHWRSAASRTASIIAQIGPQKGK